MKKKVFIIFDNEIKKEEMQRIVAYFGLRNLQFHNSVSLLLNLYTDITEEDVDQIIKICNTHMYIINCDASKIEEDELFVAPTFNIK